MMHGSQYVVNCKVLRFINNKDQEALGYKTLRRKDAITSFKENNALDHFLHVLHVFSYVTAFKISLIYD